MMLGIVVFGAAFLVLGSFTAFLMLSATGDAFAAAAVLVIVLLLGLVADTMRETVGMLVRGY